MGSFRPSEASSGLLDDRDVVWTNLSVVYFDYNGKAPKADVFLAVEMTPADAAPDESPNVEHYRLGDCEKVKPTADGTGYESVVPGQEARINKNSGTVQLLASLVKAGFPEEQITDNVQDLRGIKAHMNRVKRAGKIMEGTSGELLLVTKLLGRQAVGGRVVQMPAPTAGTANTGTPATPAAAAAAIGNGSVEGEALSLIVTIMQEQPGLTTPQQISTAVLTYLVKTKNPRRAEVLKVIQAPGFFDKLGITVQK